jgi:transposase-like protein
MAAQQSRTPAPEPGEDPAPKPTRRSFTAQYKLEVLAEYESAADGERGAILRRERLYHSHILDWRAARDAGALKALTDARTSAKRPKKSPESAEVAKLRRRCERLEGELARTQTALEALGKVHALLDLLSGSAESPVPSTARSIRPSR